MSPWRCSDRDDGQARYPHRTQEPTEASSAQSRQRQFGTSYLPLGKLGRSSPSPVSPQRVLQNVQRCRIRMIIAISRDIIGKVYPSGLDAGGNGVKRGENYVRQFRPFERTTIGEVHCGISRPNITEPESSGFRHDRYGSPPLVREAETCLGPLRPDGPRGFVSLGLFPFFIHRAAATTARQQVFDQAFALLHGVIHVTPPTISSGAPSTAEESCR